MFLLDTMVISETFKSHGDAQVKAWLANANSDDLHLSVMTIGELERGVARVRRDHPAFAVRLGAWMKAIEGGYRTRILPVDMMIATLWGRLSSELGHASVDVLVAATALAHGLTVVTRNIRHFERTGVEILNPYTGST